jgi:hypothetical protein
MMSYDEVLGIENGTTGREERSDVVAVDWLV